MARIAKDPADITIEAFDTIVARAGLVLTPDERQRMFEGYKGLQTLLARLPDKLAMEAEPAVVALLPGTRVMQ